MTGIKLLTLKVMRTHNQGKYDPERCKQFEYSGALAQHECVCVCVCVCVSMYVCICNWIVTYF